MIPSLTILTDVHPQTMMRTPMTLPSLFHALAVQAANSATAHPMRVTNVRFSFFIRDPVARRCPSSPPDRQVRLRVCKLL